CGWRGPCSPRARESACAWWSPALVDGPGLADCLPGTTERDSGLRPFYRGLRRFYSDRPCPSRALTAEDASPAVPAGWAARACNGAATTAGRSSRQGAPTATSGPATAHAG